MASAGGISLAGLAPEDAEAVSRHCGALVSCGTLAPFAAQVDLATSGSLPRSARLAFVVRKGPGSPPWSGVPVFVAQHVVQGALGRGWGHSRHGSVGLRALRSLPRLVARAPLALASRSCDYATVLVTSARDATPARSQVVCCIGSMDPPRAGRRFDVTSVYGRRGLDALVLGTAADGLALACGRDAREWARDAHRCALGPEAKALVLRLSEGGDDG